MNFKPSPILWHLSRNNAVHREGREVHEEKAIGMERITQKSNCIAVEFSPYRKVISTVGRLCEAPLRFAEPPYN